jgi:hypothetical protein
MHNYLLAVGVHDEKERNNDSPANDRYAPLTNAAKISPTPLVPAQNF